MSPTREQHARTGIARLDADILTLIEFCGGANLPRLRQALADEAATVGQLSEIVPTGVLNLVLTISSGEYDRVWQQLDKEAQTRLEQARSLFDEHLADLVKHPKMKSVLLAYAREVEAKGTGRSDSLYDALHVVTGISSISSYVGKPPKLLPAVRIGFKGHDDRLLLDTLMDWEDLTHAAEGLLAILAEMMQEAKPLAESNQLEIKAQMKAKFAERVAAMERQLNKIYSLAPTYGITLPKEAEKERRANENSSHSPSNPGG